jgi:hypothetical protein
MKMYQAGLPQASAAAGRLDVPIKVADGSNATIRQRSGGVRCAPDRFRNLCAALRINGPIADATPKAAEYYFCFANGLATSCAQSMTSCAAGLGVRFLRVIMKTGLGRSGKSTGSTLKCRMLAAEVYHRLSPYSNKASGREQIDVQLDCGGRDNRSRGVHAVGAESSNHN